MKDIFRIKKEIQDNDIEVALNFIGDTIYVVLEDKKNKDRVCIGEIKKQEDIR